MLRIGIGVADITPPVGLPLSGFAMRMNRPSVAIDDPLLVKALVMDTGEETCLLLSYDLLGFDAALDADIRRAVQAEFGGRFSPGGILITTTHTHSGPPTLPIAGETRVQESYVQKICAATRAAVSQALDRLSAAELFHGQTEVEGINHNRRSTRGDVQETGRFPLDRSLDLFAFQSPGGDYLAGIIRFTCHAVTMTTQHVSADFPGELTRRMGEKLGAPCLFLQGTAGDTNPVVVSRDHAAMLSFVDTLMAQIEDLPGRLQPVQAGPLRLAGRAFNLPFAPFPPLEDLREKIARVSRIQAGDLTSPDLQPLVAEYAAWRRADDPDLEGAVRHWAGVFRESAEETLRAALAAEPNSGVPFRAARLALGPVTFIFLSGEILTPVGQHIQALSPEQNLRIVSYLSPVVGYIADSADLRAGGYEASQAWVWYQMPGPFSEESETVILEEVKKIL